MGIKILLADDSVTAQNMGKKILSEAGHEVVTVSNGAAAAKKIAELKPELVLLDVFMPGYSGLELCEKLRNAAETSKLPVLLTVGRMEPYSPQEGSRVKADGVIIKPFEASDLTAAVERLAEKAKPGKKAAGAAESPTKSVAQERKADSTEDSTTESGAYEKTMRLDPAQIAAMLNVSKGQKSAESSAADNQEFSVATPAHSTEEFSVTPSASSMVDSHAPAFGGEFLAVGASEIPSYMSQYLEAEPESTGQTQEPKSGAAPTAVSNEDLAATMVLSRDSFVQHFDKPSSPESVVTPAEGLELTAAAPVPDAPVARETGFEPTLQTADAPTIVVKDPAFVTDPHAASMDFITQFGTGEPGLAEELLQSMATPAGEKVSVDDFEARLNAAMSAFGDPSAELPELAGSQNVEPTAKEPSVESAEVVSTAQIESDSLPTVETVIPAEIQIEEPAELRASSAEPPEIQASRVMEILPSVTEPEIEITQPSLVSAESVVEATEPEPTIIPAAIAAAPAEEFYVTDAVSVPTLPEPEVAHVSAETSIPETDDAVIEQMRESFSANSHLVDHAEVEPPPMAMAAAAAASPVQTTVAQAAELEIAHALSAAIAGETSSATAHSSENSHAAEAPGHDANTMAAAVENVMKRELPNLVWKIMAELDQRKRS